jgi:hypothetical protein
MCALMLIELASWLEHGKEEEEEEEGKEREGGVRVVFTGTFVIHSTRRGGHNHTSICTSSSCLTSTAAPTNHPRILLIRIHHHQGGSGGMGATTCRLLAWRLRDAKGRRDVGVGMGMGVWGRERSCATLHTSKRFYSLSTPSPGGPGGPARVFIFPELRRAVSQPATPQTHTSLSYVGVW